MALVDVATTSLARHTLPWQPVGGWRGALDCCNAVAHVFAQYDPVPGLASVRPRSPAHIMGTSERGRSGYGGDSPVSLCASAQRCTPQFHALSYTCGRDRALRRMASTLALASKWCLCGRPLPA